MKPSLFVSIALNYFRSFEWSDLLRWYPTMKLIIPY